MALSDYKKKRNPKSTPEPFESSKKKTGRKSEPLIFVVQKHAASHLHYDFRLEVGGVLVSWAVPKGPSLSPKDKRLAIQVEDHPFDYHDFEGNIPKGNYGAGTVMVWDEGYYAPINDQGEEISETSFAKAIKSGRCFFVLLGEKLKGRFSLIRLKDTSSNKSHWLLIKGADEFATSKNILNEDRSVITHRSMKEIAGDVE